MFQIVLKKRIFKKASVDEWTKLWREINTFFADIHDLKLGFF